MLSFHLMGLLYAILAGVAAGLISAAAAGKVSVGWVAAAVVAVFVFVIASGLLRRRRITYTITSERLTIQTGLMGRELHQTRLERRSYASTAVAPRPAPSRSARALSVRSQVKSWSSRPKWP
jgi:uncharacterized membrane protein YdbT with pleckstrin-like domain